LRRVVLRSEPLRVAFEGSASLAVPHKQPLLEGEDDALVDVAAFELAVRVGRLVDGHGFPGAQP
jgi:hypothetical protein